MPLVVWCALLIPAGTSAAMSAAVKGLASPNEKSRASSAEFLGQMGAAAAPHLRAMCDQLVVKSAASVPVLDAIAKIDPELEPPLRLYVFPRQPSDQGNALATFYGLRARAKPAAGVLARQVTAKNADPSRSSCAPWR